MDPSIKVELCEVLTGPPDRACGLEDSSMLKRYNKFYATYNWFDSGARFRLATIQFTINCQIGEPNYAHSHD